MMIDEHEWIRLDEGSGADIGLEWYRCQKCKIVVCSGETYPLKCSDDAYVIPDFPNEKRPK